MTRRATVLAIGLAAGCGGGKPAGATGPAAGDPAAVFAPLEVGADHASYTRVNRNAFLSPTHGNRFVDVWVNAVGAAAYLGGGELPVGTVVVKTSWESEDGRPTEVAGPTFVMEKRAPGFSPEHDDWWYALYWPKVPANWVGKMGGQTQVYWRSPSAKVDYCWSCHEAYDRNLGGVPDAERRAPGG